MHLYWGHKWAERLRTTTTPQVRGRLEDHYSGGRCALGVLYDEVFAPDRISPDREGLIGFALREAVAGLNDDGKTFAEIADWIEALLPPLPAPASLPEPDAATWTDFWERTQREYAAVEA